LKYRTDGAETVAVRLEREGERITISFTEFDVDAFDITKLPEPDLSRPPAERPVGGLGIHMIRKIAESVGYEYKDRVSTTTVTKRVAADV
jgi:serine/threonine-protein kinase RsbW